MEKSRFKIHNLKDKLITCGVLAVALVVFKVFDIPCVFQFLTKIPCPGCGMTRAYLSLLQLDIAGAFRLHFMFWSVPILVLYYLYDYEVFRKKWLDNTVLILIGVGFLANWIMQIVMLFQG